MNPRRVVHILRFENIGYLSGLRIGIRAFGALDMEAELTFRETFVVRPTTLMAMPGSARHFVLDLADLSCVSCYW